MKVHLILLLGCIYSFCCVSQSLKKPDINLELLMDKIFPVQDEDFNYAELYEVFAQLLANPLNINTATAEQLRSLVILSPSQVNAFMEYRKESGPLLSLYELQVIPTFHDATIRTILPFITINNKTTRWKNLLNRIIKEENNYFVVRVEKTLEDKLGYSETATTANQYSGSPYKIYNRFRVSSSGDFSLGFTTEKDPGEKIQWAPSINQYGLDYVSAHAQVQNKGVLSNFILGDYQAQFGQGLILGGGFGMGKGSETITTMRRSNIGFIPYSSASETGFFRGCAGSFLINRFLNIHTFFSRLNADGTIQSDQEGNETISSLKQSGFHRTINEISTRYNLNEQNIGGVLQYHRQSTDAGVIFHQTLFSKPLLPNSSLYNQFSFSGYQNRNVGFYWNQGLNNFSFFTEVAHSVNQGTAGVFGFLASLSPALDISIHYRRFERNYYSFYSSAIAESSTPQNEEGIYWGWKYRFSKKHSASGYIDIFRFPWLRFGSFKPSDGSEWMARYNFTPSRNTQMFFQIRQENKVKNLSTDSILYLTGTASKTNYWLNADYKVTDNLSFKTRVQLVHHTLGSKASNGIAIIQDLNYQWNKLTLSARIALFDSDSYDSRLYIYEQDAWLAFSIPAFQGVGMREYILIQFKATRSIDLWFRWARTEYENQDSIGSGGELINGNKRNDLKFQLRFRL